MVAEYKSNHYVPVWLLNNFRGSAGEFFYFNKNRPNKPVQQRNPESIFCANNYYVERNKDGVRDVSLERDIYSPLDDLAKLVADKIISAARVGKNPNLSKQEKRTWDFFFFHQWQRTPDSHQSVLAEFDYDRSLDEYIDQFVALVRPLTATEKESLSNPATRKRIYENSRIRSLKGGPSMAVDALGTRGPGIVRTADSSKSFIIGSFPVVKLTYPGRTHLTDPTVEVWMPIAHDVILTPWGSGGQETINVVGGNKMRSINEMICEQSTEVASRSNKLLRSLLQVR